MQKFSIGEAAWNMKKEQRGEIIGYRERFIKSSLVCYYVRYYRVQYKNGEVEDVNETDLFREKTTDQEIEEFLRGCIIKYGRYDLYK